MFCKYGSIWDTTCQKYEAVNAAEDRLRNHKGATVEELKSAMGVLQNYLDDSDEIIKHGFTLIRMLNDNEAFALRRLVEAQGDATINRQDRMFYRITASRATLFCRKVRTKMAKPFKVCAATAKKICRKIRKAKKKKGKKPAAALVA